MSLEDIRDGIVFRKNGKTVALIITEQQFRHTVCHPVKHGIHGVTEEGGFVAGYNAIAGKGVAIGRNAKVLNHQNQYHDAIQLGTGVNRNLKTLQIYDYTLLDSEGFIPEERFPDNIGDKIIRQSVKLVSDEIINIEGKIGTYLIDTRLHMVDLILPSASKLNNLSFTFKFVHQGIDQYPFKLERSGEDVIIVDGEEWTGISCDRLGSYFTLAVTNNIYYLTSYSSIEDLHNVVQ